MVPFVRSAAQLPRGFSTCEQSGVRGTVWCGMVSVPENRGTKQGRVIPLNVVILPAIRSNRKPDPVFWIEGGPGGSAIDDVSWWQFSPLRADRDLVYVDLRGTGRSRPLKCDLFERDRGGYQHFLGPDLFPEEEVRRCGVTLSGEADLRFYTTSTMVDDLDDVRAALGYDRINIVGLSGGTHSALVYLRRHSAHVRSLVLNGLVAPYHMAAAGFARYAQTALEGLARECASDHNCHQHFSDVSGDALQVLANLEKEDATANIPDPATGEPIRVVVNRGIVAEIIRNMLYTPSDASDLPLLLHLAAQGNFAPLAELALARRLGDDGTSYGVYFSAVCAEDFPRLNVKREEAEATGTFLGVARVRQISAACAAWPIKPDDSEWNVTSNVPVLIISGQLDPVTPPSNVDAVARNLPNSRRVLVPSGGHCVGDGLTNFNCVDRMQFDFIERGSGAGLDTTCLASIRRRGFSLELEPSAATRPDPNLAIRFRGHYTDSETGKGANVKLEKGVVRLAFDDGENLSLFALGDSNFRVWGSPTRLVHFQISRGAVTSVTLTRGGVPELTLRRSGEASFETLH
jgi:pimeloyl-ACP methyl ester carboxylesterase